MSAGAARDVVVANQVVPARGYSVVNISGNLKLIHLQGVESMSQAARKRAARRHKQPFAWLGVGAVTLGMGAAMVGGTAVAFAEPLMLFFIAGFIGTIFIGMVLPIFSMQEHIK